MGGGRRVAWVLLLAGVADGCATNTAPRNFLPAPAASQRTAYGGWIEVTRGDARHPERSAGELLAIQHDSVYLLSGRGPEVYAQSDVTSAKLTAYDSESGLLATWTLIGTLSTISHGWLLVLSAPVWIIAGSVTTAHQSHQPEFLFPTAAWEDLRAYARFPQGLPPGLDLATVRGKPLR